MSKRVKILSGVEIASPKAFLISSLETGIVAFALRPKFVSVFEVFGSTVDRKPVIVRDSNIFFTASVFFAVVPVFVIAGTNAGFMAC